MEEAQARLAVVRGPDEGRRWSLDPDEEFYTIGRAPDNKICLGDPTVSKRHALVECVDRMWFIRDLGSKHGTWVEDEEVGDRRALFHKDVVRVGKTYLLIGLPEDTQ